MLPVDARHLLADAGMARRPEDLPAATLGEAMDYIELHRLQSLVSEALEAVVASRSPDPVAFIVRWLRRKRQASVAVGVHRHLADPHASSVAELCTTGSDRRRARPLNGTAAAYAEEGASPTQTPGLTSSVRTSESAAAMAGSMRRDDTTLEELHAAHAAPKARDDALRTTLLPEPVLRSIYAVASESSLNAALVRAPPSLQDAIACREGLWGGLVHMTLCSFSEHGGVDVRAAAEALLATTTASSELVATYCLLLTAHCSLLTVYCSPLTTHHLPLATEALLASGVAEMASARSLSIPAECWSWGGPQRAGALYAGRHILVCNLTGGSDCMGAVVRACAQRGLKNARGMADLHVTLPLAGTGMPASDADIRAFLARLEWELAVVRLEGPKAATTPLRVEYRRALALSPDVIRQFSPV